MSRVLQTLLELYYSYFVEAPGLMVNYIHTYKGVKMKYKLQHNRTQSAAA